MFPPARPSSIGRRSSMCCGDIDDFGRIDDRPRGHFRRIRAEPAVAREVGLARPMGNARRAAQPEVGDAQRMPGNDAVELRLHRRETCRSRETPPIPRPLPPQSRSQTLRNSTPSSETSSQIGSCWCCGRPRRAGQGTGVSRRASAPQKARRIQVGGTPAGPARAGEVRRRSADRRRCRRRVSTGAGVGAGSPRSVCCHGWLSPSSAGNASTNASR